MGTARVGERASERVKERASQGNIIAQRAFSAAAGPAGTGGAAAAAAAVAAENRERTTFCFPLLGSERIAVVDVCTASVVIHVRCLADAREGTERRAAGSESRDVDREPRAVGREGTERRAAGSESRDVDREPRAVGRETRAVGRAPARACSLPAHGAVGKGRVRRPWLGGKRGGRRTPHAPRAARDSFAGPGADSAETAASCGGRHGYRGPNDSGLGRASARAARPFT